MLLLIGSCGYVICKEYIHFAIKYIHFVYWFRRITVLREAFVYLLDFSGSADMVLEQCHRDGNGSLECPQTCEDLDPEDGELSCKRCGGCWKIAQSFSVASKSTNKIKYEAKQKQPQQKSTWNFFLNLLSTKAKISVHSKDPAQQRCHVVATAHKRASLTDS